MNAWRCTPCKTLFVETSLLREGKLFKCPICKRMVCNVTYTRIGEEFLQEREIFTMNVQDRIAECALSVFDFIMDLVTLFWWSKLRGRAVPQVKVKGGK
jgi:hypothetical protein